MNSTLIEDSTQRPDLFDWNGSIDREWLSNWLQRTAITLPDDLITLWMQTGGGDMFESETILSPTGSPALGDEVLECTAQHHRSGLPQTYCVIHTGVVLTAVRLSDGKYVVVEPDGYQPLREYNSLDSWYKNEIRSEYAERYGLKPLVQ